MSIKTLIVDDDPIFVMMLKKLLAREPFFKEPNDFSDGQLALEFLKTNYDPATNYVIFLDINMPVMNGWEFLEGIREFADPKNTMVFIVTSSINRDDVEAATNNEYVLEFLTKPIPGAKLQQVKEKISEKLRLP